MKKEKLDEQKSLKTQLKRKKKKELVNYNWIIKITLLTFFISLTFSSISEFVIPNVNLIIGIILVIIFIFLGIIFDMIGVAVTSSDEEPLHAMSSKKIKGAKKAVSFKKNADRVSSFCNDVIGDICGIISGSAGVSVSKGISDNFNLNLFYTGLIVTALIAASTIGGKAFCKRIAIDNNHKIVYMTAKVISKFG